MVSFWDTAISLHILQPPLGGGGCSGEGQFWTLERKLEFSIFGGGGVLGKVRLGLWEEFHFRGGCSGTKFQGQGGVLEPNSRTVVFWRIWSKISGNLPWKLSLLVHHR